MDNKAFWKGLLVGMGMSAKYPEINMEEIYERYALDRPFESSDRHLAKRTIGRCAMAAKVWLDEEGERDDMIRMLTVSLVALDAEKKHLDIKRVIADQGFENLCDHYCAHKKA